MIFAGAISPIYSLEVIVTYLAAAIHALQAFSFLFPKYTKEVNSVPYQSIRLEFIVLVPMPVQKQGSFVSEIYRPYWVVSAVLETYTEFQPVNSYQTGKGKAFLSHSHLPPAMISTFSTSSRGRGLILAIATSPSSSSPRPLSLSLSNFFFFSLSFSVFQTSQMIISTPKK